MKCTISEWNDFWKCIDDNWYMEDSSFPDEGNNAFMEGDAALMWQGSTHSSESKCPLFSQDEKNDGQASFWTVFRRWKKTQNTETFVIRCPKERAPIILENLKALGATLVK